MHDQLIELGFSKKEASVYLALLEFGTQTASVIARRVGMPRPTVLYLFKGLLAKGYIRKTQRGRTQHFHADPSYLKQAKKDELKKQEKGLEHAIPLLEEFKTPFSSPPKLQFFEGLENCRKAYMMITESETDVYEFAAHDDLIKMGEQFMEDFISARVENGVLMRAICRQTDVHEFYLGKDEEQNRELKMFDADFGGLYSSVAVFENKVLLLNLYSDAFAILIESHEVAETLKTIHRLVGRSL